MDCERKIIIDLFKAFHKQGLNTIKDFDVKYQTDLFDKSYQKSVETRKEGNRLFTEKKHDEKVHEEVWKFYCQSIAYAPNKSEELATGYANRSVLLLHLKKYKESLLDIARSLKITESSALKVKLFCRQIHCLVALQEGNHSVSMEKAKFWLNKVDDHNEIEKLNVMINKAEKLIEDNIPADIEKAKKDHISCENDSVGISYDEKCGRCLIATRSISPGEFVYVEKFYATSINTSKLYAYCSHCLAISWALIPCDKCAYYMFCSSDCKDEAWEKYHSIECNSKLVKNTHITDHVTQLSMRSLIMGIKEAGSIEKLKNLVNEVDKCKCNIDPITKGFSSDGQFSSNSFKSLYSLSYSKGLDKMESAIKIAFDVLLSLAKNTVLFEKKFVQKKLTKNEDAIFIGSLLIRLISIFNLNSYSVLQMNRGCTTEGDPNRCRADNDCCSRGTNIALFTSLINHSCSNNVSMFHTNDGRVVYYAIKPIKKNSQIFSAYICNFVRYMKENRQRLLELVYEFKCDCTACRLNWPVLALISIQQERFPDNDLSIGLLGKHMRLMEYDEMRTRKSRKTIRAVSKDVELVFENVKEPTVVTASFYDIFISLIENRYCKVLKVPSIC